MPENAQAGARARRGGRFGGGRSPRVGEPLGERAGNPSIGPGRIRFGRKGSLAHRLRPPSGLPTRMQVNGIGREGRPEFLVMPPLAAPPPPGSNRAGPVLFGDGAGALVVGPAYGGSGIRNVRLRTFGELSDLIQVPDGVMPDGLMARFGLPGVTVHRTPDAPRQHRGPASIPLTLDAAARQGALNRGDLVLMAGFGGSTAAGLALIQW